MKILNDIKSAFAKHKITLKNPDHLEFYNMENSITNKFIIAEDVEGKKYLIRINGKLWPPFTRANEKYNLIQLNKCNINTSVIENNIEAGFQICAFEDEKNKYSTLQSNKSREGILEIISSGIKKIHQLEKFKGNLDMISTVNQAIKNLSKLDKNKLSSYYEIIITILMMLNSDVKNFVFSHNDLLPSSIYLKENKLSLVDWEYSGNNHRSYDLAFFSVKSSLSGYEEQKLVSEYDKLGELNMEYAVTVMKPVVTLLCLLWNLTSKQPNVSTSILLHFVLSTGIQEALSYQSQKQLRQEMKLVARNDEFLAKSTANFINCEYTENANLPNRFKHSSSHSASAITAKQH